MNFNTKKYIIKSINIFIDSTFIFAHFRASGVSPESIHIEFKNLLNSIEPGKSIDDKTFILDLKVIINNKRIINLELQISNERNWPDRSLGYLCRSYDNLNKGDDYIETKPAVQNSTIKLKVITPIHM